MQDTPARWVRDATASRSIELAGRWAWTHKYGTPLLIASIVAVVLSGSGLFVAVNTLGDDGAAPLGPTGSPTPATEPVTGPECVTGTWRAIELEEDIRTGILIAKDPVGFEYTAGGTAVIDYGELTEFTFEESLFGGVSEPTPAEISGTVTFEYEVDGAEIRYDTPPDTEADINIPEINFNLPYHPAVESFAYECTGDRMTQESDDIGYRAVLERA